MVQFLPMDTKDPMDVAPKTVSSSICTKSPIVMGKKAIDLMV